MKRNPIQPVEWDENNVLRFKKNAVVCFMEKKLDELGFDLNELHRQCQAPHTDWDQFNMLIGYSVSGCPIMDELTRYRVDSRAELFIEKYPQKLERIRRNKQGRKCP